MSSSFCKRFYEGVDRGWEELERVTEHNVLAPLDLEILLHVLSDHFELTILDVGELVDDQMRIVSAKIMKKDRDLVVDLPLEIALLVSGADEPAHHVIVIADFDASRIMIAFERFAADVALSRIVILLLLTSREPFHRHIFLKVLNAQFFPFENHV